MPFRLSLNPIELNILAKRILRSYSVQVPATEDTVLLELRNAEAISKRLPFLIRNASNSVQFPEWNGAITLDILNTFEYF